MFRQLPIIETIADAVDELTDVRMTLSGLASLTLALANSGMHEADLLPARLLRAHDRSRLR